MEVNWTVIGIGVLCAIILIVFLFKRNLKDKKEVEKFFNENEDTKIKKEETNDDEF